MRAVGITCEIVDLVQERGSFPIKVAVVDEHASPIYDRLITPSDAIVDFRTWYHGLTPETVAERGIPFSVARNDICVLLKHKIVVGYDLKSSLKTMLMDDDIPKQLWRDTATARLFRVEKEINGAIAHSKLKLEALAMKHLQLKMSSGPHNAMEDCKTAMLLYRKYKDHSEYDWYGNFR